MPKGKRPPKADGQTPVVRRAWGELEAAKPRIFRPSPDVAEQLDAKVVETGRTQSAIIDEGLRRSFWSEQQYAEAIERNFGGETNATHAFLMARIMTGIEHAMQARADARPAVGVQIAKAMSSYVASAFAPDFVVQGDDGQIAHVEIKRNPGTERFLPPADWNAAKAAPSAMRTSIFEHSGQPDISFVAREPWLHVMITIDENIKSSNELWWPLTDGTQSQSAAPKRQAPLQPTIDQLKAVWRWRSPEKKAERRSRKQQAQP